MIVSAFDIESIGHNLDIFLVIQFLIYKMIFV